MRQNGFFIVLEGIDGSGKATQTALLSTWFAGRKEHVLSGDFPRYETSAWGKLVGRFLRGDFGRLASVDPHLAVLPYMLDQYTWSRDVARPWLTKGGIILLNRYFTSNVHQIAKKNGRAKAAYREWIWNMGYQELGILRPDLVVFLDVPPQISKKLIRQKPQRGYLGKRKRDIAERDGPHQTASYRCYLEEVSRNDWWVAVKCIDGRVLDSADAIHERIVQVVKKRFYAPNITT